MRNALSLTQQILLLGRPDETATALPTDPDAQFLIDAVNAVDTVPAGWDLAWHAFVLSAKANGYWNCFGLLAPLLSSGLTGAMLAYNAGVVGSMTNVNFVSSDYVPASGLLGDGASKYLRTGRLDTQNSVTDYSLGFVQTAPSATGINGVGMGTLSDSGGGALIRSESVGDTYNAYIGSNIGSRFSVPAGLICASRTDSTLTEYQNGASVASATVGGGLLGVEIYAFCFNHNNAGAVIFANARFNLFFAGSAFSASQMAAFYADLQVFLSAVGRPALP